MRSDAHDALATYSSDHRVRECLHDVPPHEVWAVAVDGERAVCKLSTHPEGAPATEAAVLAFVDRETSVPVPSILAVGADHFLAAWRDDAPSEDDAVVDPATVRALGRTMARLHDETEGSFVAYGFPSATDDGTLAFDERPTWHAVVSEYLRDCRSYLEDIGYDGEAGVVLDLLDDHPGLLDGVGGPVLCHGNLLPAHAAVANGSHDGGDRVTCVIDFEHALVGPAEYDYWRTVTPVFGGESDHDVAEATFREGYESIRPLPDGFERRARVHWLVDLVSYLRALDLQNRGIGPDERANAEKMATRIREVTSDLRSDRDE